VGDNTIFIFRCTVTLNQRFGVPLFWTPALHSSNVCSCSVTFYTHTALWNIDWTL